MPPSADELAVGDMLRRYGVSRRGFIKYCTAAASAMALPPWMGAAMAQQLQSAPRPSVIYLSFQECTGCFESFTRSFAPTMESLIFNVISLDYDDTLMAAAGDAAESALAKAMHDNFGKYVLIIDGSVPTGAGGGYCTAGWKERRRHPTRGCPRGGRDHLRRDLFFFRRHPLCGSESHRCVAHQCDCRPTRPIINVSGCPPIPEVITGTLLQYVTTGKVPDLDEHLRPKAFFGTTIHDRCYRRPFYDQGKFAKTFDDEGARNGWCLYELGCKGPTTYNACATTKWNGGTSFPIESGHGCIGCSEPGFWDKGSLYSPLSATDWGKAGESSPRQVLELAAGGIVAGGVLGVVSAGSGRLRQYRSEHPLDTEPEEG